VLFEIEPRQPVGVLFGDFALLDLLAIDENGQRPQTLVLGAAGRPDQSLSDRTVAEVLPQVPDGPSFDQNATPYRP
jgi:hypothetical protein